MSAIRRMARSCALTSIVLGVTATTLAVAPAQAAERADSETASQSVAGRLDTATGIAQEQVGDPYSYGAAGPNAFDCSGLIYYSYSRAGFDVPRTSGAQAARTRRIARSDMRKGDLIFFFNGGGVYHAAIFLRWQGGQALMLDAPGSGRSVQVVVPWTSSWFGGTLRR